MKLFDALYKDNLSFRNIGKIFNHSRIAIEDHNVRNNLNMLGDPEMPVWTNDPRDIEIQCISGQINVGNNELIIKVTGLFYHEKALVCIYKDGKVYGVKETATGANNFIAEFN